MRLEPEVNGIQRIEIQFGFVENEVLTNDRQAVGP